MPTAAPTVVLTRPEGQNANLAARLEGLGRVALQLPALRLTAASGPAPDPQAFDLVMFVSGNAVRFFLHARYGDGTGRGAWPAATPAAVVGPSSAAALTAHAAFGTAPPIVQPPADSRQFDSEALWQAIEALPRFPREVMIVRGGTGAQARGRDWLARQLEARGARVTSHRAYVREPAVWTADQAGRVRALASSGHPAIWLLTSQEGADAVFQRLGELGLLNWWRTCRLVATHPRIARHLMAILASGNDNESNRPMLQTCSPRDDDILAAIESVS